MLSLIFSNQVTVDKYRNDLIINIQVYSAVNKVRIPVFFVCAEVLQPSQPNGVMLSAVSLPNHTFTGQA